MGEETGRKSALRRVKLIVFLAVISAISLAPAISFRLFPRETLVYFLKHIWGVVGSKLEYSMKASVAIAILTSFIVALVTGSALLLVLFHELTRSVRREGDGGVK